MSGFALGAKVEAAASNLSSVDDWYKYCESNTIDEALSIAGQKPLFGNLKRSSSIQEAESDLRELMYSELGRFQSFVGYPARSFLNIIIQRRDMETIKDMIRYKHAGLSIKPVFPPSNPDFTKYFDEAASVLDIISSLKDSIYYINLQSAVPNYENTKSCFFFETALDYTYWHNFRERMSVLYGADKSSASEFVGTEEDLHNLSWIYRAKFLFSLSPDEITTYILPNGYLLKQDILRNFVNVENKKDFTGLAAEYGYSGLFKGENDSSFEFLLLLIKERLVKSSELKRSGLGYLLWYAVQIQTEINMLIMILEGIEMNIGIEERKSVIREVF